MTKLRTLTLPLALLVGAGCSSSSHGSTGVHEGNDASRPSEDAAAGAPGTGGTSGPGNGGRDASGDGTSIAGSSGAGGSAGGGAAPEGGIEAGAGGSTAARDGATGSTAGNDSSSCSETPCRLTLPQCGCGAADECSLVSGSRTCVPEGTVQEGRTCGASAACAPGLLCLPLSQLVSTCQKFCSSDADCGAPGGLCTKTVSDGQNGTVPNATLCTESCNPVSNVGCPVAGTSCRIGVEPAGAQRTYTDCGPAGTKTQGQTCDPSIGDCAPGFACTVTGTNQSSCLEYCTYPSGSCPIGTTCLAMTPAAAIGGVSYGVCY